MLLINWNSEFPEESRILLMEHKYSPLISLFLRLGLPRRARKEARKVGDSCRARKEVWLEPPAGARIRKKENTLPLFSQKNQK